ncbi:MAG: single-stranded-DNA-specific exonuclease RecJ [Gammaproteobacteria bacterium]|nr:MAG: single-stranded-DNA-specific exonuclease RecJ [Gammaproteobacteria bacterium]
MLHKRLIHRIEKSLSPELAQSDLHPVLKRIYSHRNVQHLQQISYSLERLLPLEQLKGMEQAVAILSSAVIANKKILIVGDFDADGATSSAVCYRALTMMGATHVSSLVPNRFDFGYGLTPELVALTQESPPDVLITVDNGISSIEGVAAAKALGIQVVVTDHHLPGDHLPDADAIVNPNQPGCKFSSKNLAGVGVVFYVMLALRQALRNQGWFNVQRAEPNMGRLLDLVALGTVADVVPLDDNNRILVEQGLKRIRAGQCCAGIQALLDVAGRNAATLVASDLGFAVGPRLNAAGRLEDMSLGIECLLTDDMQVARMIAAQLDELNRNRRVIEQDMQQQAMNNLQSALASLDAEHLPKGICLYHPEWHQGVIGILASRIKEKFNRPVIAFADSGQGEIKGSARSIKGLHIRDALDAVNTRHPGLILKFGGHAMAAGLSLLQENFAVFQQAFDEEAGRHLDAEALQGIIESDGVLNADDMNIQLAECLRQAGPWGQHFPEPLFDGEFIVDNWRVVGEHHLKMQLQAVDTSQLMDAIAFNIAPEQIEAINGRIRAAYRLDVNHYMNRKSAQLIVEYFEPL